MLNERKLMENEKFSLYEVTGQPDHRYIVYQKVSMNNFPGCKLHFKQEVYRSWNRTKKMYSYFGV